eukprot:9203375-Lingulodinium_polyedra.AAC.1
MTQADLAQRGFPDDSSDDECVRGIPSPDASSDDDLQVRGFGPQDQDILPEAPIGPLAVPAGPLHLRHQEAPLRGWFASPASDLQAALLAAFRSDERVPPAAMHDWDSVIQQYLVKPRITSSLRGDESALRIPRGKLGCMQPQLAMAAQE